MKSMLHEAPSILKAIEKAWQESGQPKEFTIKVMDPGEPGILWFSKRPAIVSIIFDPRKQLVQSQSNSGKAKNDRRFVSNRSVPNRQSMPVVANKKPSNNVTIRPLDPKSKQSEDPPVVQSWNHEYIDNVKKWVSEIIFHIKPDVRFEIRTESKTLTVGFDKKLLIHVDDERLLYASFSYLLMQFLKKTYKKKLRGYYIIFTTRKQASNVDTKSSAKK
jgi:predicted RNA-binding protein Jag